MTRGIKYFIISVLVFLIVFIIGIIFNSNKGNELFFGDTNILGDVNGNGKIDSSDFVKIQKHMNEIKKITSAEIKRGDINGDGKVTSLDYVKIKKAYILGTSLGTNQTKYKITFDANGGSVSKASIEVNKGASYGELPTPTRSGYRFVGWFTKKGGTFDYKYYADTYSDLKKEFGYNESALLAHWFNYGKSEGRRCAKDYVTASTVANGNTTLYAGWVANKIKITLDANGGSVSKTSIEVNEGASYGELPTPIRNGYRFVGWFTKKDGKFDYKYYADTYSDLKKAFGYNEKSLLNHWFDYGMSEGRRCAKDYVTKTTVANGNTTLYAGWISIVDYYNNSKWNKYKIVYSSSVPLKGTIVYKSSEESNATETFFLEASSNGTFTSYINYWIDENEATGIKSIKVEDLKGNTVNAIHDIKLEKSYTASELLSKYSHNKNDYNSKTIFIKNDYLTLGISLEWGGTVTYLSGTSKTYKGGIVNKNVVNTWDAGREIQDALYGNSNYNGNSFGSLGYNPVQGGYTTDGNTSNVKSYGSKIIDIQIDNNKNTITVISRPLLWALANIDYINSHSKEYNGRISEGYIYQTYKLVNNRVELSHSYIDFSDNYSDYYDCSGHSCPFAEAPVIYATADLNILKYKELSTGKNIVFSKDSQFDDIAHKVKIVRSRYAGLYTSNNQGIGMYIKNLEGYRNYNNLGSVIYFHANYNFMGNSSSSSQSGDTIMLHLLNHIKYTKGEHTKLPDVSIVLGSYEDLVKLTG